MIAVLISGTGRTLENLIKFVPVSLVISSKENIRGNQVALDARIPLKITKYDIFDIVRDYKIGLICLAGWLHKIHVPEDFTNKVLNIHPSLLPSFGGKGMYGSYVHQAVIDKGCKVSGCTVHFVDNEYDNGPIICQSAVPVLDNDTPDTLASRVFSEECVVYPKAVNLFLDGRLEVVSGRVRVK